MSELKVIKIELNNHGKPIASIQGTTSYYGISPNDTFYPKEEADKVIAELKSDKADLRDDKKLTDAILDERNAEIAELQKQVHDYAQGLYVIQAKAEKEARRHKYKRCLAMAAYCNAKIEEYQANYDADEGFGDEWLYWIKFMRKWMRRWLEFADKLKECF